MFLQKRTIQKVAVGCFALIVIFFFGCQDDFDMTKIDSDIVYKPNIAMTIGTVNIELNSFLKKYDSTVLHSENDGLLYLLYEDDLASVISAQRINIPEIQNMVIIPALVFPNTFPEDTVQSSTTVTLPINLEAGQVIDSLILKTMSINISGTSTYSYPGKLYITFENVKKDGKPFTHIVDIPATNGGGSVPVNSVSNPTLAKGYKVDLKNNAGIIVKAALTLYGQKDDPINLMEALTVNVSIQNVDYEVLFGYVSRYDIMDDQDTIDMKFLSRDLANNIEWADPSVKILFQNNYGVPIKLNIQHVSIQPFQSNNLIDVTPIGVNPKYLNYPAKPYTTADDSIVFNRANSKALFDSLGKAPSLLTYHITGTCNADDNNDVNNFVMDTSIIKGKFIMKLPLHFRSAGFVSSDTLDFSLDKDVELTSLTFTVGSKNELPIDMMLQLYFLDENNNIVGTLFDNSVADSDKRIIKGALEDSVSNYTQSIVFTDQALANLKNAKKIRYETSLITTDYKGSAPYVKMKKGYKLKLKFTVEAQAKAKFNF